MSKEQPIEIFMPPNMLKAKVGGTFVGLDMAAIKRAEAAVETLKVEFTDYIEADVERLAGCRDVYIAQRDAVSRADLYRASHDLKGQALTFEYPLAARVASSLCKMLDHPADALPQQLIDAHVNAVRIIVRDKMKSTSNKIAMALAAELETRVAEFVARPA
jgi:hypothetical protein